MNAPLGRRSPRDSEDEGVALILVLLFVVLLTALVVDFSYEMQVEASLAANQDTDFEAYLAAKSAIAAGMGILASDLIFGEEEADFEGQELFDSFDEPWAEGLPLTPLNDAVMRCTIDDEYGKLNLNAMVTLDQGGNEVVHPILVEALEFIFELRKTEEGIEEESPVDAIIDWLDSDDDTLSNGAENEYYSGLEVAYTCKNGPMDTIEELLLIPGITPEVYFGDAELGLPSLESMLTVNGHPEGRVNANTATIEVIAALLFAFGEPEPERIAEEMMISREEEGPFTQSGDFSQFGLLSSNAEGREEEPSPPADEDNAEEDGERARELEEFQRGGSVVDLLDWASSGFRLFGDGQSGNTRVRIVADIWRDTYGSGSDQMFRVMDWRIIR